MIGPDGRHHDRIHKAGRRENSAVRAREYGFDAPSLIKKMQAPRSFVLGAFFVDLKKGGDSGGERSR